VTIRYTRHAQYKLKVLEQHGFPITAQQVADTLVTPDIVIPQSEERYIAQKGITEHHVLRVVYRREGGDQLIITLYPGRRERYEDQI